MVLGIQCGTLIWGVLTSLGMTAQPDTTRAGSGPCADDDTVFGGWRQGITTNLLNPKMGAFYVAVLPQFIPVGAPHLATGLLLTGVHILLAVCWSYALIAFARALRGSLQRPSVRRCLDRVTGAAIAVFGLRLALGD